MAYGKTKKGAYMVLGIMVAVTWFAFNQDMFFPTMAKMAKGVGAPTEASKSSVDYALVFSSIIVPLALYAGHKGIDLFFSWLKARCNDTETA